MCSRSLRFGVFYTGKFRTSQPTTSCHGEISLSAPGWVADGSICWPSDAPSFSTFKVAPKPLKIRSTVKFRRIRDTAFKKGSAASAEYDAERPEPCCGQRQNQIPNVRGRHRLDVQLASHVTLNIADGIPRPFSHRQSPKVGGSVHRCQHCQVERTQA